MAGRNTNTFLVSRDMTAVAVNDVLKLREAFGKAQRPAETAPEAEDRPVVEGGRTLRVNRPYKSSANDLFAYYLPAYAIAKDAQGRPQVELRFTPGTTEVRRLTINLSWHLPRLPRGFAGRRPRVMQHRADLVLRYRVPIAASDGSATAQPGAEQTVTLQPLQITGATSARSITEFADRESFEIVYAAMRTPASDAQLEVQISAPVWLRTYRQVLLDKYTARDEVKSYLDREAYLTRWIDREKLADVIGQRQTGRARVAIERPDAVPAVRAPRPELRLREDAVVRPAARSPVMEAALRRRLIAPERVIAANRVETRQPVNRPILARAVVAQPALVRAAADTATPPPTVTMARATARPMTAASNDRWAAVLAAAARANYQKPSLAESVRRSDMVVEGRRAVPAELVLDKTKRPALLDVNLKAKHRVGFHFDPAIGRNSGVFVAEGMGGIHLLKPRKLVSATGRQYTVYQDNLMPDVLHVEPSVFRLVRESLPPHRPSVSFVGSDFNTSDNDEEAEVLFQMLMVYRLEPWLDPDVIELAREELAKEGLVARFVASLSSDASLELDVDFLGDEQNRTEAEIDTNEGITDSLMLNAQTFTRLWRDRLGTSGEGVKGTVQHRLFDGTEVRTEARLSLWETSDELCEVRFVGPVSGQPGVYRVTIRNRIESQVVIDELPGDALGGNAVAHAVDAPSVLGRRLAPQETIDVDYAVTPTDAQVTTLDPPVVGRIDPPDLQALLQMMMVNSTAGSLGFSLTVRAVDGTFAPPTHASDSSGVLVGLRVEFDDGSLVELDADESEVEVMITSRLINALMGDDNQEQRYFYRVTNVHPTGEGARTAWMEGHGAAPLEVGQALVELAQID